MNPAPTMPWLWPAIAITLAVIGLIVLVFALFRDRSRGRRRCPKCWYSMDGAPTLTCPECGRVAKTEKKLFKTRRSRRGIAVALALFTAAYSAWKWPALRREGWTALIPTTALVFIAPVGDPSSAQRVLFGRLASSETTLASLLGRSLEDAMWYRFGDNLPLWQAKTYLRRCMAAKQVFRPDAWITAPTLWVEGEPLPIQFDPPWDRSTHPIYAAIDGSSRTGLLKVPFPADKPVSVNVSVHYGQHTVFSEVVPINTIRTTDPAELFEPMSSPEADGLVGAALKPRLVRDRGTLKIYVQTQHSKDSEVRAAWRKINFALGYRLRILSSDGRELGTGVSRSWWEPSMGAVIAVAYAPEVQWHPGALDELNTSVEGVMLVIEGDAAVAFDQYGWSRTRERTVRWAGRVEVPLLVQNSAAEDE
jgi:hypothetical protein